MVVSRKDSSVWSSLIFLVLVRNPISIFFWLVTLTSMMMCVLLVVIAGLLCILCDWCIVVSFVDILLCASSVCSSDGAVIIVLFVLSIMSIVLSAILRVVL